ncbi:MAG: carboxylesterase/lipase family protein [Lachnospiraceae bacterium]|nr:carboxylesterase/lipase family protein [Lachnospiraceae bacterium]
MEGKFFCTSDAPVVETRTGKLRGYYFDGVYNFFGVRYATAKRFEMPEEVKPWEGIKDALAYGKICPLLDDPSPSDEIVVPHRFWPMSEDCLNLNIWTGAIGENEKRPVMVWFHGGGYSSGSSIEHIAYEGDSLARKSVVMVGVNHRLNVFGHLDMSPFGEKYKNSVNAGIVDLVASLRWIRDNIAGFGGDPDNVTIFGQSGGGGKVTTLGQAAEADGLFHKAIVMSGVFPPSFGGRYPEAEPKEFVLEILSQLRLEEKDADELQKVPVPVLIAAVNRAVRAMGRKGKVVSWAPHKNDWYAGDPLVEGFRDHYKEVPTIVGTCFSEFMNAKTEKNKCCMTEEEKKAFLTAKYGENTGKLIEMYRAAWPEKDLCYAAAMDYMTGPASVEYARKKSEGAHADNYEYLFAQDFDYDNGKPAWHCADIPFFFGNAERIPYCHSIPNMAELNRMMSDAFVNFARTGKPSAEGLPEWLPATETSVPRMVFGEKNECRADFDLELLSYVKEIEPPLGFFNRLPKDGDDEEEKAWIY